MHWFLGKPLPMTVITEIPELGIKVIDGDGSTQSAATPRQANVCSTRIKIATSKMNLWQLVILI
jgi:hypothetical protein